MKISEVEPLIRAEWLKRPEDKRTGNDVLAFYFDLENNHPRLLSFRCKGDKYQELHVILSGLITE